ncbi:MAG: YegS/Rv2252/BmrU family lipid kinase [Acidimicrobiaceae bacterium]|nr:YegS/Rv2252/BmrU family lipid kinase [Acidimicrobiaceae bacterium]
MSQVALLANPAARSGRAAGAVQTVLDRLRTHEVEPLLLNATSAGEAATVAADAVASGVDRLVVFGGDGIIQIGANAAAGSDTVLGLVAGGTGNDAAEALGLRAGSLEDRVDRALADPVPIDLIWTGERHAVTSCVAGFPADVNVRAEAMRFPRGPSRYTLATLAELPAMRPGRYRLTLDGEVVELTAAVVVVANTAFFGGGMRICPDADPTDGLLDVCIVGEVGRLSLLRSFAKVRTGAHVDHPGVSMFRAAAVAITALDAQPGLRADGEPFGSLPCELVAQPEAIRVAGANSAPADRA